MSLFVFFEGLLWYIHQLKPHKQLGVCDIRTDRSQVYLGPIKNIITINNHSLNLEPNYKNKKNYNTFLKAEPQICCCLTNAILQSPVKSRLYGGRQYLN